MEFSEIKKLARNGGDWNFCTVISASIAFEKDYAETYDFFRARGRTDGRGIPWDQYEKNLRELGKIEGYKVQQFDRATDWDTRQNFFQDLATGETLAVMGKKTSITIKNFRDYLPRGNYIFGISGHVLAVKNGAVVDWTADKKRNKKPGTSSARIFRIWKIEKIDKKLRPNKKAKHDFSSFV